MKKYLYLTLFLMPVFQAIAQTGIPVPQMTQADNLVKSFMNTYAIPGLTIALSKNGKIVYMRGFGYEDVAKTIPVQPNNLFRIASCSKQITAIAIMKLFQEGKLTMSSKVFGTGGILENSPIISTATITDNRIYNITVSQLLEHTAGWDRDINCNPNPTPPYSRYFSGCDPINNPLSVSLKFGSPNPVSENYLIKYLLEKGLNFNPGARYAYSNIGYLCLGAIIEKLSGKTYENYVKTDILEPLGIYDMHTGGNLLSHKMEREVEYVSTEGNNLSVYGTGQQVPWQYGGMNVTAMSAHGGWISTARDFVKLLSAVDGFSTKPDILTQATISEMTKASTANPNYAKGWLVNSSGNWWHTGAIPGTASIVVRTSGGYSWFVIMNKRGTNNAFWTALDNLGWNIINATTTWPTWDLMLAPTNNAANIVFSNVQRTSLTVSWTKGNGGNRLLVIKPENPVNEFPLDGTDYVAGADYGTAPVLKSDVKIVYNGTGNSVTVTGLEAGKKYHFRVIEYNKNAETGNHALYVLGKNPVASRSTAGALPVKLISLNCLYTGEYVALEWSTSQEINVSYYLIQRSSNGIDFTDAGRVSAGGNSQSIMTYHFSDQLTEKKAGKLFYRLKMIDLDGSFEYSSAISVNIPFHSRFAISPNPAKNILKVNGNQIFKVEIYDLAGRPLIRKNDLNTHEISINISGLTSGAYLVRVTGKDEVVHSEKLVIQK